MATETQPAPDEEAGVSVAETRDELDKQIIAAAERNDRLAFFAAAERYGSLEEAQALVRSSGIVRSCDRTASPTTLTRSLVRTSEDRSAPAPATTTGADPVMFGHFSRFNEWTEINSLYEGNFLERVAPGAFKKTFRENRHNIRALFQHGHDPSIGDKPLGPIDDLREDAEGGYYEVPLLDAPYVRQDVLPGLREGLYGASFKFRTMREEFNPDGIRSDYNPKGIPERTLNEVRVFEFGPVSFPAYEGATAAVRSAETTGPPVAPSVPTPPVEAPGENERRDVPDKKFRSREEWLEWISKT